MSEIRTCQNCKSEFGIEPEDFEFYEKIKVPPPTFCPSCRRVRRMLVRNLRSLYHDNCDMCGKQMLSMYAPESSYTVYCRTCFNSDNWDAAEYGREYDPSRSFFEQYGELLRVVPRIALLQYGNPLNSDTSNSILEGKNLYLCYSCIFSEDSAYIQNTDRSKNTYDCYNNRELEDCYENVNSSKNYRCVYVTNTKSCINSSFLFDCSNCQDCFMSSSLRNRQYVIRNVQYDKEEYEKEMARIDRSCYGSFEEMKEEFSDLVGGAVHKYAEIIASTNATGDKVYSSNNVRDSFSVTEAENVVRCDRLPPGIKDAQDVYGGRLSEILYEGVICGSNSYNLKFYHCADASRDTEYTEYCHHCSSVFGCIGLKKKQYCILNKKYSKEEYEELRSRVVDEMTIKGEYGEFFPKEISPFAYNESAAQEYVPLTKERAIEEGFRWRDPEKKDYETTIVAGDLPDAIDDVGDDVLAQVIECEHAGMCNHGCTSAFRVTKAELSFYRDMRLPLPRMCPNCRHVERLSRENPPVLYERQCMCDLVKHAHHESGRCSNTFKTTYALDRKEVVYCEQCYQQEVV